MTAIDPCRYYTSQETAEMVGLGPKSLSREINAGRLRVSVLPNRARLIEGAAILEYLKSREVSRQVEVVK